MPQISGWRTNQLGNLVTMLKFRTVYFDHRTNIAKQNFSRSFHNPGFA